MQAVGHATQQLCVQSHNDLREKTTACIGCKKKHPGPNPKNKGSGEHRLRPVMRATAPEPRRSLAIRALPLPDSIVLAGKLGVFPGYSVGAPILRRILSSFSPPARRRSWDAHTSENWQSLHCQPSKQSPKQHLLFQTCAPLDVGISLYFNGFNKLSC
jgi:hypothetical protein